MFHNNFEKTGIHWYLTKDIKFIFNLDPQFFVDCEEITQFDIVV